MLNVDYCFDVYTKGQAEGYFLELFSNKLYFEIGV